jgi:hypothetical protein
MVTKRKMEGWFCYTEPLPLPVCNGISQGQRSNMARCGLTQSEGEVKKRSSPVCQQELYLWELSCVLTTKGLQGRKWGDKQLRALLELIPRRLSHHTPNLSWQQAL